VKITAVIVAGGKGTRMGASVNKVFLELCGKPIIAHTVDAFEKNPLIDEIIVVTGKNDIKIATEILRKYSKISAIIEGGNERQQSVSNGINAASGDIIAIHDGARALIGQSEINSVINDCIKYGAAALGVPCKDTLKEADDNGFIRKTIDRSRTYQIQTPQVFKAEIIKELHKKAELDNLQVTDDCAIAEQYGIRVKITEGSYDNLKITTPEDMAVGEIILRRLS
jgi:2-C-methyl-D-erythritol 4-phosphate cytidylyltransferase